MDKVRIGIVGLGRLGIRHAENLAVRTPGAELAAVCALEPERVAKARADSGVPRGYAQGFLERFGAAYLAEAQEFVECIREGRMPSCERARRHHGDTARVRRHGVVPQGRSGAVVRRAQ